MMRTRPSCGVCPAHRGMRGWVRTRPEKAVAMLVALAPSLPGPQRGTTRRGTVSEPRLQRVPFMPTGLPHLVLCSAHRGLAWLPGPHTSYLAATWTILRLGHKSLKGYVLTELITEDKTLFLEKTCFEGLIGLNIADDVQKRALSQ